MTSIAAKVSRIIARTGVGTAAAGVAIVLALSVLTIWLRQPANESFGFINEDVAGITYNADLLLRHRVPLVDSAEMKAPGSFFVTGLLWAATGRGLEVLQRFGIFWALLGVLGMFVGGTAMYGLASGAVAALLYAVFSPITDGLDVNYNAWMSTPYIWATALLVLGLRDGRRGWFVASGAMVTIAALMKHQGMMVAPLFAVVIWCTPYLERPEGWATVERREALLSYIIGGLLGFVPIAAFYAAHGDLGAFFQNFFLSNTGWRYVEGELNWAARIDRLEDGALGLWKFMAVPTLLVTIVGASVRLQKRDPWTTRGLLLVGHLVMGAVGVSIGFRYFRGYYLQLLPAAAWVAAHPQGPLLRWTDRATRPHSWEAWGRRGVHVMLLSLLFIGPFTGDMALLKQSLRGRRIYSGPQIEARRVGDWIRRQTQPDDRLWVWGRWAWPVYYYADRLSPTRFYKVLGIITTNLTNTWKRPTAMTRYVRRGPWREVNADLERTKPVFIVTARNESYAGFTTLERMLSTEYRRVPRPGVRSLEVWVRADRYAAVTR